MTVLEAAARRESLRLSILRLVNHFEEETGLKVADIYVQRERLVIAGDTRTKSVLVGVDVEVQL